MHTYRISRTGNEKSYKNGFATRNNILYTYIYWMDENILLTSHNNNTLPTAYVGAFSIIMHFIVLQTAGPSRAINPPPPSPRIKSRTKRKRFFIITILFCLFVRRPRSCTRVYSGTLYIIRVRRVQYN